MLQEPNRLIAYYRVSTEKQGASGLGLEGQVAAVEAYGRSVEGKIIRSYKEIESGKKADRPELAKALADARLCRATLVIAKLDRLARNVHFLSGLMESNVQFVACDNPHATRVFIHILAAMAEEEARQISKRTKAALAAYKARGGVLGSLRLGAHRFKGGANDRAARRAGETATRSAEEAFAFLEPTIAEWRAGGASLREIAARLNQEGHQSRRGKPINAPLVARILARHSARSLPSGR